MTPQRLQESTMTYSKKDIERLIKCITPGQHTLYDEYPELPCPCFGVREGDKLKVIAKFEISSDAYFYYAFAHTIGPELLSEVESLQSSNAKLAEEVERLKAENEQLKQGGYFNVAYSPHLPVKE